jgi:Na+/melibiose symporter-like transporter
MTGLDRLAESQSESAIRGTCITVALIPGLLMLVSLFVIYAYRLDERRLSAQSPGSNAPA